MSVKGNKQDFDKDLLALMKKYDKIPVEDKDNRIYANAMIQRTVGNGITRLIDSLSGLSFDGMTVDLTEYVYHLQARGAKVILPPSHNPSIEETLPRIEDIVTTIEDVVMKQYEKTFGEWED